jgi:hypothetical protein
VLAPDGDHPQDLVAAVMALGFAALRSELF